MYTIHITKKVIGIVYAMHMDAAARITWCVLLVTMKVIGIVCTMHVVVTMSITRR